MCLQSQYPFTVKLFAHLLKLSSWMTMPSVEAAGELVEESCTCPSSPLKEVSLPLHWEILMSMLKIPLRLQAEGRADEAIQCKVKEHLSGIG